MSDMCGCPKECEILHYKAAMSYAAANQDSQNKYELSETFLETTGKQLNDSIDIMERQTDWKII